MLHILPLWSKEKYITLVSLFVSLLNTVLSNKNVISKDNMLCRNPSTIMGWEVMLWGQRTVSCALLLLLCTWTCNQNTLKMIGQYDLDYKCEAECIRIQTPALYLQIHHSYANMYSKDWVVRCMVVRKSLRFGQILFLRKLTPVLCQLTIDLQPAY